jgi:hypothetical protein
MYQRYSFLKIGKQLNLPSAACKKPLKVNSRNLLNTYVLDGLKSFTEGPFAY